MKRIALFVAMFCAVAAPSNSWAGPISPITGALFNGTINNLHDKDAETIVDGSGNFVGLNHVVGNGDFLLAVFQIENIDRISPAATNTLATPSFNLLTGVSLLRVNGLTPSSFGLFDYQLAAPTAAEWLATTGLVVPDGTVISTYDNTTNTNPTTQASLAAALAAAATATPAANLLLNLGFTGSADPLGGIAPDATKGEGWRVLAPDTLQGIANLIAFGINPGFRGGLTQIGSAGPKVGLLDLQPTTDFAGQTFNGIMPDMVISGNLNQFSSGNALAVGSGSDAFINPVLVPEPGSIVMWSGLACIAGLRFARRRSANAA